MPVIKPRAPEYPRPVSPISADEVPVCKDTVLYYDRDDGVEEDEKQRLAKRRRIEAYATNYLRGRPLFILTAGLRGPFDDGWQNPWARRRITEATVKAAASPQHSYELPRPTDQAAPTSPLLAKKAAGRVATDVNEDIDAHFGSQGQGRQNSGKVPELRTVETSIFGNCAPLKDQKVEHWLRTSEAYGTSGYRKPTSTPTSPCEGRKKTLRSPGPTTNVPCQDAMVTIASDNALRQTPSAKPSKQLTRSFSSPLQDRIFVQGNGSKGLHSSPLKPKMERAPLLKRASNALLPSTIESRAEYAILKSRRNPVQLTTTATDPGFLQTSLDVDPGKADELQPSHPELRMQSTNAQEERDVNGIADVHSASKDASASLQTAQEQPLLNNEALGPMSLEKETSVSGTTTDLPSAQVPEVPILPSLLSNISSHDQMLQDSHHHETWAFGAREIIDKTTAVDLPTSVMEEISQHVAPGQEPQVSKRSEVEVEGPEAQVPQEIESNMTSGSEFMGASTMVRTLTRSFRGAPKGASPVGVKKMSVLKTTKRQAFATEERSGSIKAALKVGKPNAASEETTIISKAALDCNAGHQIHEIDSHEEVPERGSAITSRASVPKSILKAVAQHSIRASASITGSSSFKPDAQKQKLLNLVDNDDGFDLEGAIDDLGSYLDTWDAEKHAAGVL